MVALILQASIDPGKKEHLMLLSKPVLVDAMERTWVVRSLFFLNRRHNGRELTRSLLFLIQLLKESAGCESCTEDPDRTTHPLRRLLIALCRRTQTLPKSFLIRGVRLRDKVPINGGGFADIFRGSYKGETVALKRLRNFGNRPIPKSEQNVSRIS